MSVDYTYDDKRNVLYTRFFGVVIDEDLTVQAKKLAADPRIKPGLREIADLSDIEKVQASSSSLGANIDIDRAHSEKLSGMRTAVVAPTDFLFGFARMYELLAELQGSPSKVSVFRTVDEARRWLGLNDGDGE